MAETVCTICGRVKWEKWVSLGFGKGRHDECALGSQAWLEHYQALSLSEQEPLRHFFEMAYPQTEGMQQ